jgi:glycosyltransferase involved in cell wall biosynthesis
MNTGKVYDVSVVMPCLNESRTLGICIKKALDSFKRLGVNGEVIVSDNGSTDNSAELARSLGARVVFETEKGYGSALRKGISEADGTYIIMGDADDSYDFSDLEPFVKALNGGADFVMGTRMKGRIEKGAMPMLHRYLGTPVLTWVSNLFFGLKLSDNNCGMRAFTKKAYEKMHLVTSGMEFASEMIIKAAKARLKTVEVPISYYKDKRGRKPHLRSFSDGWRHLRFMLLFSPIHLFVLPGTVLIVLGFIPLIMLFRGPLIIGGATFDYHYMIAGSVMVLIGIQIVNLGISARIFSRAAHLEEEDKLIDFFNRHFTLEKGIVTGLAILLSGVLIFLYILMFWATHSFSFAVGEMTRPAIMALTLTILGFQVIFNAFFLSLFYIKIK